MERLKPLEPLERFYSDYCLLPHAYLSNDLKRLERLELADPQVEQLERTDLHVERLEPVLICNDLNGAQRLNGLNVLNGLR